MQTSDRLGAAGAGGAQHVEPRAVAVVDLEAEARRGPDHLGVGVDDRHVDAAGEQRLARHLAEAAEADDQRLAGEPVGACRRLRRTLALRQQPARDDRRERRQRHRDDDRGVEHAPWCSASKMPTFAGGRVEDEGELAALRHEERATERLRMVRLEDPRDDVDADALDRHEGGDRGEDHRPVAWRSPTGRATCRR